MNTRSLQHFLALADCLHFGRASEACHISISALSRNIRQLEETLDVTLFNRDNRTVTLTPAGRKFQSYAREATTQWNVMRHTLANDSGQLYGEISMYCSVTASYSILFERLNRLRDDYPGIEIKLHTGDPEHAIARVAAGKEDLSIAAHPGALPRGVLFKPITVSPLLFIGPLPLSKLSAPAPEAAAPHQARLSPLPPRSAQQWAEVPMILAEDGISRKRIDAWFREHQVKPRIYAQVAGNEAIVSMVSLGLGVGVVPQIVLAHSPMADRIQVLAVEPQLEPYHVGLFTLKRHLKNPLVQAFWALE